MHTMMVMSVTEMVQLCQRLKKKAQSDIGSVF